jgi:hypothetical protein
MIVLPRPGTAPFSCPGLFLLLSQRGELQEERTRSRKTARRLLDDGMKRSKVMTITGLSEAEMEGIQARCAVICSSLTVK